MALPHIVTLLADDYGWANVGYHHASKEVVTPNIDGLKSDGIELTRHYAYRFCSPSRSSFQSGRLPVHVNTANAEPTVRNPDDPIGGYAGIPVNMSTIASTLKAAGYATAFTGKWDVGMATWRHTPLGRGYDSFFGYFHHANDYWTEGLPLASTGTVDVCKNRYIDLWSDRAPARRYNGTAYEEEHFTNHSLSVIGAHDAAIPLFLVHAFHIVHTPLQLPEADIAKFKFVDYKNRRLYAAMVHYMDTVVGRLRAALTARAMWDNTLLVFASDNGGPVYYPGSANNYPLKGGKMSDWEGGVRVNALVSGGLLPPHVRGTKVDTLCHIADWYATFAALAKVDGKSDPEAKAAGLPPIDSQNLVPAIFPAAHADRADLDGGVDEVGGTRASQLGRDEVHLSKWAFIKRGDGGALHKLVTGWQLDTGWTGPTYPNRTGHQPLPSLPASLYPPRKFGTWAHDCGDGCLFDVAADETEHHDLAASQPALLATMHARLVELNQALYEPDRGEGDPAACAAAEDKYGGFYGPWM